MFRRAAYKLMDCPVVQKRPVGLSRHDEPGSMSAIAVGGGGGGGARGRMRGWLTHLTHLTLMYGVGLRSHG
jgi:hypothetical protein